MVKKLLLTINFVIVAVALIDFIFNGYSNYDNYGNYAIGLSILSFVLWLVLENKNEANNR